jgi:hypothetical protein
MLTMPIITITSDERGRYPAKRVLAQIKKANETLHLGIQFPDKPITETCLYDLSCDGYQCTAAYAEGRTWDDALCTYTERQMQLIFG